MNEMYADGEQSDQTVPEEQDGEGSAGYSIVLNCYEDGTHDVYAKPLEPASKDEYPDGVFGLESLEEALKAVIALKQTGKDFRMQEHDAMMGAFAGKDEDQEGSS